MIRTSHNPALLPVLPALLFCLLVFPFVSAAGPALSGTVPPILQVCSHAQVPEAGFTCSYPDNESGIIPDGPPYTLQCRDNSSSASDQPVSAWNWEFGDGGTSAEANPRYSYAGAGQYDITLTVNTICGSRFTDTVAGSVAVYCSLPQPAFTTNATEGFAPMVVQVTDASLNTSSDTATWTYLFDNTPFSNDPNPVFVYTIPGTYTITQMINKDCVPPGSIPFPPAVFQITVNPPPPVSVNVTDTNRTPTRISTRAATLSPAVTSEVPPEIVLPETTEEPVTAEPTETAQNPPMAPGTGMLSVRTEPAGAQVSVDGVPKGTSPATLQDIPAGSHTLRLEQAGYQTMVMPVIITAGQMNILSTNLAPESPGIAILPVAALVLIVIGIAVFGIFLYRKHKKDQ
jgi:hypothetical protein